MKLCGKNGNWSICASGIFERIARNLHRRQFSPRATICEIFSNFFSLLRNFLFLTQTFTVSFSHCELPGTVVATIVTHRYRSRTTTRGSTLLGSIKDASPILRATCVRRLQRSASKSTVSFFNIVIAEVLFIVF